MESRIATFAAGSFWGVESTFRQVSGVLATRVGYMGGSVISPSHEQVGGGQTGHAEVCEVTYDPGQVSFEDLLAVFWSCHDPAPPGRQDADLGSQHRSVIYCHDDHQVEAAARAVEALDSSGRYPDPLQTEVHRCAEFWPAEEEHQQFLEKDGRPDCPR
ncbi:MAG: peptide-methionine (S)-S-oxide reductase MsrA [Planctomycetes bacterium]|nr:peptide-methionine (S)-S-oxide reductase MsrA [Planctomycetota bacterium]MBL7008441.1 peptide-methionine (S)-S-oxide reductase MsrA [Planctomycetota bacterium]